MCYTISNLIEGGGSFSMLNGRILSLSSQFGEQTPKSLLQP